MNNIGNDNNIGEDNNDDDMFLQLGDIIQLIAPSNPDINKKTFLVYYLDTEKLRLINTSTGVTSMLLLNQDGSFKDESIANVTIILREKDEGFARQNGLTPGVWLDIYFGGDLPQTITGQITDLEEDMIEVKVYPENTMMYIDFEYKGIPEQLPITKMVIRDSPMDVKKDDLDTLSDEEQLRKKDEPKREPDYIGYWADMMDEEDDEEEDEEEDDDRFKKPVELVNEEIQYLIISGEEYEQGIGEELEELEQMVEVPEEQKRYSIENQNDDLLNDMLSKIPVSKRNHYAMSKIQNAIERYNELRREFSLYDSNNNIIDLKKRGATYKPLFEKTKDLKKYLHWFVPVTKIRKNLYPPVMNDEEEYEDDEELEELDQDSDVKLKTISKELNSIKDLIQQYRNNQLGLDDETNHYDYITKHIDKTFNPFSSNKNGVMIHKNIQDKYHGIVDNGDFNTTTLDVKATGTTFHETEKKFFIQKYNLGYKRLVSDKVKDARKGVKIMYKRKTVVPDEDIDILSFMVMPKPYIEYSKVNLPSSSILTTSHLSQMYMGFWNFLKKNQELNKRIIDNIDDDTLYGKNKPSMFGKQIANYYSIDQSIINDEEKYGDSRQLFEKYLQTILPKTRALFHMLREENVKDKKRFYSMNSILLDLQPFLVYKDDISFKQYEDIVKYIAYNIKLFRQDYVSRKKDLKQMVHFRRKKEHIDKSIYLLLTNEPSLRDSLYQLYDLTYHDKDSSESESSNYSFRITSSEMLHKMNEMDNMKLLMYMIAKTNVDLFEFYQTIKKEDVEEMKKQLEEESKELEENDELELNRCKEKTLSKKYIEEDELEADNDNVIYYDKSYDKTNYDIIQEYQKERSTMTPVEFVQFLKNKLMDNIGLSEEDALNDADNMIRGKKMVREGDYAVLEKMIERNVTMDDNNNDNMGNNMDGMQYFYYVRQNNNWVRDTSINPNTIISEFCNIKESCFKLKDECQRNEVVENKIKQGNLKQMVDEFENKYNEMKSVIIKKIDNALNYELDIMKKLKSIRSSEENKYDVMKLLLGKTLKQETDIVVQSPYMKLRDSILGQNDMVKKYNDIQRFSNKYCRQPLIDNEIEDPYWLYCVQTNTKLLPSFILRLANAFTGTSNENYLNELAILCKEQGTLSDDGDKWVDKHSGFTIRTRELDEGEGFTEEGYKIVTRSVMEKEHKEQKEGDDDKENMGLITMIENIIQSMSDYMGIKINAITPFIIRETLNLIDSPIVIRSFQSYKAAIKKKSGKSINMNIYNAYRDGQILFITLCYLLIGIQIHIPTITSKKTFPTCKRSFSGFPLDDDASKDGLIYIACVANKIKSSINPWNAIKKQKEAVIIKQMNNLLTNHILKKQSVINLLNEKRKYDLLQKDIEEGIPKEHVIEKWFTFLPPLSSISLANGMTPQNISNEFSDQFLKRLKRGDLKQYNDLNVIRGKIIQFTMFMIQSINKIVKQETFLLTDKYNEPMIENNCCMESSHISNALSYFNQKDGSILQSNTIVEHLSNLLKDTSNISKAQTLYSAFNTKMKYPALLDEFDEETMYRFFIHYCKFDTNLSIPENLLNICISKPSNYKASDSITEKIRKLKEDGQYKFSKTTMYEMLTIVNQEHLVHIDNDHYISEQGIFGNMIRKLDEISINDKYIPSRLLELFNTFMEDIEKNDNNNLSLIIKKKDALQNTLLELKENYIDSILTFIGNYSTTIDSGRGGRGRGRRGREKKLQTIRNFLDKGIVMKTPESNVDSIYNMTKEEFTLHKGVSFMKNNVRDIASVYPEIILHKLYHDSDKDDLKDEEQKEQEEQVQEEDNINEDKNTVTIRPPLIWRKELNRKDIEKIYNNIGKHIMSFKPYYNNSQLHEILEKVIEKNRFVRLFTKYTPVYKEDAGNIENAFMKVFDNHTGKMLYEFYLLQSIKHYIDITEDVQRPTVVISDVIPSENSQGGVNLEGEDENLMVVDEEMGGIDVVQRRSNNNEVVSNLLVTMITHLIENKNIIDQTHNSIKEKMASIKTREKDKIIKKLDKLKGDRDLSGIQREMKKLKLGEYNPYRKEIREYVRNQEYFEERMLTDESIEEIEANDMSGLANDDDYDDRDGDEHFY